MAPQPVALNTVVYIYFFKYYFVVELKTRGLLEGRLYMHKPLISPWSAPKTLALPLSSRMLNPGYMFSAPAEQSATAEVSARCRSAVGGGGWPEARLPHVPSCLGDLPGWCSGSCWGRPGTIALCMQKRCLPLWGRWRVIATWEHTAITPFLVKNTPLYTYIYMYIYVCKKISESEGEAWIRSGDTRMETEMVFRHWLVPPPWPGAADWRIWGG